MTITYVPPPPNPWEQFGHNFAASLAQAQQNKVDKERLAIQQQQLQLQQQEAQMKAQQEAERNAQAWNAFSQAMQTLGPQGLLQVAPNATAAIANANVRAPQVQTEVNAAVGKGGVLTQAVAGKQQEAALAGLQNAKSINDIVRYSNTLGYDSGTINKMVEVFADKQIKQAEADSWDKFVSGLPAAQQKDVRIVKALKESGLTGENLENEALRLGVQPTGFQAAQVSSTRASAAASYASARHSIALAKADEDKVRGQKIAAARLGEANPIPGFDYIGALENGVKERDPQGFLNRAAISYATLQSPSGKPFYTPDQAAQQAVSLATHLPAALDPKAPQLDVGHASDLSAAAADIAKMVSLNETTQTYAPAQLKAEARKRAGAYRLKPQDIDSIFDAINAQKRQLAAKSAK